MSGHEYGAGPGRPTCMQPDWILVATLGDVNPIDHGGSFVFIDRTGAYPPELEIWNPISIRDSDEIMIEVSRLILEPHTHVNGVLSDNPYHPEFPVWYAKRLVDVCASGGLDPAEMISALCGRATLRPDDKDARSVVVARAEAYIELVDYFGTQEFDQGPVRYSYREAEQRLVSFKI